MARAPQTETPAQSAGQSATPASTRTSAHAAEQDSTFTLANARRTALRGWSAATHTGSVFQCALQSVSRA